LLGEHVDYNDGPVLPAALDRSVRLVAAPDPSGVVTLYARDLDQRVAFRLGDLDGKVDLEGNSLPAGPFTPPVWPGR